jgi:hypothetical protein
MAAKSKFTLYSCKLRLEGSPLNEVPKDKITAGEIEMYRAIHGSDAIVAIREDGSVERSDIAERRRIQEMFLNPTLDGPIRLKQKTEMFRNSFGHDSLPMPKEMVTEDPIEEDDDEETTVVETAPRRTRAPRQTEAPANPLE